MIYFSIPPVACEGRGRSYITMHNAIFMIVMIFENHCHRRVATCNLLVIMVCKDSLLLYRPWGWCRFWDRGTAYREVPDERFRSPWFSNLFSFWFWYSRLPFSSFLCVLQKMSFDIHHKYLFLVRLAREGRADLWRGQQSKHDISLTIKNKMPIKDIPT